MKEIDWGLSEGVMGIEQDCCLGAITDEGWLD